MKRKVFYILGALLFGALSMSVAFNTKSSNNVTVVQEGEPTNLQVLPKETSMKDVKKIMWGFNQALGVKCSHCHAPKADGKGLDFASDDNHKKLIARGMMHMTKGINENYFYKYQSSDVKVDKVSCVTCHNKKAHPKV
ncbi:MAG: c-type cytochrome [Brumimicrobium sp.]|nr:c-type cytochrome [Brumimicrobium sp.]